MLHTTGSNADNDVRPVIHKVREVYRLFDAYINGEVAVAYSGGKDSTALALLLRDWLTERDRRDVSVLLVHSDTLSEIPEAEAWVRSFMPKYIEELKSLGVDASYQILTPLTTDTFYWRLLVRGYPAPTYNFRWCVKLLKRKPAIRAVNGRRLLLLGHRDSESRSRALALKARGGSCPLKPGGCTSYFLHIEGDAQRMYPIRSWEEEDVWQYLAGVEGVDLSPLFKLYGPLNGLSVRYGCWHCTLVKTQAAHLVLGHNHMYFEAVRMLYRWLSDEPSQRESKNWGYSRLGPLKAPARSLMLHAMLAAEKLSGLKLYGLDESKIENYTLRELFTEVPEEEADMLIAKADEEGARRFVGISELRNMERHVNALESTLEVIRVKAEKAGLDRYLEKILTEALK